MEDENKAKVTQQPAKDTAAAAESGEKP